MKRGPKCYNYTIMPDKDGAPRVSDTQRTDLLMTILQELRELREERAVWDKEITRRIESLEKELELVRIEQQANGTKLAEMELQCRRRLEVCRGRSDRESKLLPDDSWVVPAEAAGGTTKE